MVLKEEGHVLRVEDGGSRGTRLPRVNEDMIPYVLWFLGLNLYIKYSQRIMGKSEEGNGAVGSGERREGVKGPERRWVKSETGGGKG